MTDNVYQTILLKNEDGVSTITLNRPERKNAFNDKLVTELNLLLEKLKGDNQSKVIILQGAGDAFCSGADLEYLKNLKIFILF